MGWIALGFHFTALVFHIVVFGMWASHHVGSMPDDPMDGAAADTKTAEEAPKVADRPIDDDSVIDDAIADMKNPVSTDDDLEET